MADDVRQVGKGLLLRLQQDDAERNVREPMILITMTKRIRK